MKTLPPGYWVSVRNLVGDVTDQDLIEVIASRTGITMSPDQISMTEFRPGCWAGLISFSKENIRDLLLWAMQDDTLCGKPIEFVVPVKKAA
jgi:hypothetical protein